MGVFHFLRHGEHGLLGKVLAGRMPGVGMTERGRAEIASQAERLAREKIAAIYASPLQRTRETAEIVAARLSLPIEFRDDLLELDFARSRYPAAFNEYLSHYDETTRSEILAILPNVHAPLGVPPSSVAPPRMIGAAD